MGVQFAGNILVQSNGGPLPIVNGGTGQTSATSAFTALAPSQGGNSGKVLTTNGTVASWATISGTPGGSDTYIQYNDSGTFGGSSFLTVNKSTGAITSTSTLTNQGIFISKAATTSRTIDFQTAGSDRWLLSANATAESGANAGSDFQLIRVADNGATQNTVYTISRATGVVDFATAPTVAGSPIGSSGTVTSVAASVPAFLSVSGSPITTSGTLAITLSGTALPAVNGGTAQTTYTTGDILYASASNTLSKLAIGSSTQVLTVTGGVPVWAAPASGTASTLANATTLGTSATTLSITGFAGTSGSAPITISSGTSVSGGGNAATFKAGTASGNTGGAVLLQAGDTTDSNNGGALTIRSGAPTSAGGTSGIITIHSDSVSAASGAVTIRGGDSGGNGASGAAGSLTLRGGDANNGATSGVPGAVVIRGGNAVNTQVGGSVTISSGVSAAGGGALIHNTGTTSTVERFRILANGAWSVGAAGTDTGSATNVLTSNGSGSPPTWQAVSGGSGTVTSVSVTTANGVSGSVATATTTPAITLTLGAITPSSVSTAGNLTLSGSAARILGDFSNATVLNRTIFQTSTSNSNSNITIMPNGSGTGSSIAISNSINLGTNGTQFAQFSQNATVTTVTSANIGGTGTALPLALIVNANASATPNLQINANGSWSIGGATGSATNVLTSNGSGSAPTWSAASFAGGSTSNAVFITSAAPQLTLGTVSVAGQITGVTNASGNGAALTIQAATSSQNGGVGGATTIKGGEGTTGTGGAAILAGGEQTSGSSGAVGGDAIVRGGYGQLVNGGTVRFQTMVGAASSFIDRLIIGRQGDWTINSSVGTSGFVLTSAGSGATPVWAAIPAAASATNIAGGANRQIPYQTAASTTAFSTKLQYDDSSTNFILGAQTVQATISTPDGSGTTAAGTLLIKPGASGTSGAPGTVTIQGGLGAASASNGGAITLTGGVSGSTGNGGTITITGGSSPSGTAGDVTITGGAKTTGTGGKGGTLTLGGGVGIGSGAGNAGGDLTLSAGSNTTGTPGAVSITGGTSGNTAGGAITIAAGTSAATAPTGGTATFRGADATTATASSTATGGAATVRAGDATATAGTAASGVGGSLTLRAGNGDAIAGAGSVTIAAGTTTSAGGANVTITAGTANINGNAGNIILRTGASTATVLNIDPFGGVLVKHPGVANNGGGLGYGTGAGAAVTQLTSRTTGVTIPNPTGAITLFSDVGTTAWTTFTVTNTIVSATDTVVVSQKSGTNLYQIFVTAVTSGTFNISFATTGGTATDAPVFNFAVIKAVAS